MQFQIECNSMPGNQNYCVICNTLFVTREAQVIVCNELGQIYGEVCPSCLGRGIQWLNEQFDVAMTIVATGS